MPIVKANQPLPSRPPIILYYGDPGICKTTLFNTSDEPLLIDFDRGAQRSTFRKDVLSVNSWEDVLAEEAAGTFKMYRTIGIDTAKACLDDFLMAYVISKDYKMRSNKLQAYGAIGDDFKLFVNQRRNEMANIVIIAHAKTDDKNRTIPDITGQSYALLMRIADQVGHISMKNGQRVINWDPTDITVGKNVAQLPETIIPDKSDPAFRNFNAELLSKVKEAISAMTEEQREAVEKSDKYTQEINECTDPEDLTTILHLVAELPEYLKAPLKMTLTEKRKGMGWIYDSEAKAYALDPTVAKAAGKKDPPAGSAIKGKDLGNGVSVVIEGGMVKDVLKDGQGTGELFKAGSGEDPGAAADPKESKFTTMYETYAEIEAALDEAKTLEELQQLYQANEETIVISNPLTQKFMDKDQELSMPAEKVKGTAGKGGAKAKGGK